MAEHMLILKLTSPEGEVKYVTGAFPSACGKTNLAMLIPTLEGWTVETVGDDIAWMKFGDGRPPVRRQPRGRLLRRRPEHQPQDQPERDGHDRAQLDLHQLRAHRRRRHLVGGDDRASRPRTRSTGRATTGRPIAEEPAAHPNARFTTPAAQCPSIAPEWEDPAGRADRRLPVRRPARDRGPAGARGVRLGARRLPRRDDVLGDDRRRGRRGRQAALRPDGDAAVLRLQHGRLLRPLARARQGASGARCRGSSSSTGSARTTTAGSCGPASARTAACSSGSSAAATARARRSTRRSASSPRRASSTSRADISDEAMRELLTVDPEQVESSSRRWRSSWPSSATAAGRDRQQLEALRQRLASAWRSRQQARARPTSDRRLRPCRVDEDVAELDLGGGRAFALDRDVGGRRRQAERHRRDQLDLVIEAHRRLEAELGLGDDHVDAVSAISAPRRRRPRVELGHRDVRVGEVVGVEDVALGSHSP